MSENTLIEWAASTFNPWEGCQRIGPGCDGCYAESRNARFAGGTAINWGPGAPRRRTSLANWRKPVAWNAAAAEFMSRNGRRQSVFCASLADVFDNVVDPAWRNDLFRLIEATPNLDWLILTKRIGNVRSMVPAKWLVPGGWPAHVRLGVTIVNQEEANRDIWKLLELNCPNFLSMEPLRAAVDLTNIQVKSNKGSSPSTFKIDVLTGTRWADSGDWKETGTAIQWVIVGGESGPNARLMHPAWAQALRDQCTTAGVPFLFKQWGEWMPVSQMDDSYTSTLYRSNRIARDGQDQATLDEVYGRTCKVSAAVVNYDGTVLDPLEPLAFTQGSGAMLTYRVGKKSAGRALDGTIHNQFPL